MSGCEHYLILGGVILGLVCSFSFMCWCVAPTFFLSFPFG
jgi:hypothetical protein